VKALKEVSNLGCWKGGKMGVRSVLCKHHRKAEPKKSRDLPSDSHRGGYINRKNWGGVHSFEMGGWQSQGDLLGGGCVASKRDHTRERGNVERKSRGIKCEASPCGSVPPGSPAPGAFGNGQDTETGLPPYSCPRGDPCIPGGGAFSPFVAS